MTGFWQTLTFRYCFWRQLSSFSAQLCVFCCHSFGGVEKVPTVVVLFMVDYVYNSLLLLLKGILCQNDLFSNQMNKNMLAVLTALIALKFSKVLKQFSVSFKQNILFYIFCLSLAFSFQTNALTQYLSCLSTIAN